MIPTPRILFVAALVGGAGTLCFAVDSATKPEVAPGQPASVARGEGLVNRIAMCADCHTPRLPTGALDATRAFHGSTLGFAPIAPMPWVPTAPAIAGFPGYTDEQAVTFLTTGQKPNGQKALPPMPEYRFTETEARDVVAYLRSLKAPGSE